MMNVILVVCVPERATSNIFCIISGAANVLIEMHVEAIPEP